jgi:hypothetical protein
MRDSTVGEFDSDSASIDLVDAVLGKEPLERNIQDTGLVCGKRVASSEQSSERIVQLTSPSADKCAWPHRDHIQPIHFGREVMHTSML